MSKTSLSNTDALGDRNVKIDVCETLMPPSRTYPEKAWPLTLIFHLLTWILIGVIYSSMTIYLPSLNLLGQNFLSYQLRCDKVWENNMTFDIDFWPTDQNIKRVHQLIKDYLPTKFEDSGAKRSWVISCTRLRDTDRPTDMCKAICPSFFKNGRGGHKNNKVYI